MARSSSYIGNRVAMVIDGVVMSAPVLRAGNFDGRVRISGAFDARAVMVLIALIEGGLLPVRAELLSICPAQAGCDDESAEPGSSPAV